MGDFKFNLNASDIPQEVLIMIPLHVLITLGCYALFSVGYHVFFFNNCEKAKKELEEEIEEANAYFKKRKYDDLISYAD